MWGLREQVSLLLAHGHSQPHRYPIGVLWEEVQIVRQRLNGQMATEALLTMMAVSSVISEKAGVEFNKVLNRLSGV